MRPAEFPAEAIIEAGQALQAAGRNVTGFALRQKVGGGNPSRLRQVWDEHLASNSVAQVQPVAELPVEVAEEVSNVTKALTERIAALAVELNDKAVKAAERRVAEVLRTAGEQRKQDERELADAATTVVDLESTLDDTKAEVETLTTKLSESQAHAQAQAVELAQLRERLAATEQTNRADAEKHAAELARAHETAERLRAELDALRKDSATELDQVRVELASVKATTESDLRHAREEARNHQLAAEQANALLGQAQEELAQTRKQISEAREDAARLRGQVEELVELKAMLASVQQAHAAELEQARNAAAVAAESAQASGELAAQRGGQVEELRAQLGRMEDLLSKLAKQPAARKKAPGKDGVVNSED